MVFNAIKKFKSLKFIPYIVLTVLNFCVSFASTAIELEHLTTFSKVEDTQFNWQQVIAHPNQDKHFYVFSSDGKTYQINNGGLNNTPLLDLQSVFNKNNLVQTALALHPNFSLKDLPGYHTFYTAHIEDFNDKRRLVRLPKVLLKNNEVDLVVYEWKIDILGKHVESQSKREIIRVASPNATTHIKQLSFNPYLKPWQDEYGKLFITLNQDEDNADLPIYSGAILRIHPEKFGLRNYTIPENNPFNSDDKIDNEIVALGGKDLQKILWQKKNNKQWYALTNQAHQQIVKVINYGEDLRKAPIKSVWQGVSNDNTHQVAWYEGRQIDNLLYKLITLEFSDEQWQMFSLTVAEDKTVDKLLLGSISNVDIDTQLGLTISNNYELILLNRSDGVISQVESIEISSDATQESEDYLAPYATADNTKIYQWLAILFGFGLAIYAAIKIKNYDREKALVRKHYNRFEFSNYGEQIDLFKRHQKLPNASIKIEDVICSKIMLNNEVINIVDNSSLNTFSNEAKSRMNDTFAKEHRLKMIDTRARVISIQITDKHDNNYIICLYARRGNQRYTRIDYQECLNMINYWCNKVSEVINTNHVTDVITQEPQTN